MKKGRDRRDFVRAGAPAAAGLAAAGPLWAGAPYLKRSQDATPLVISDLSGIACKSGGPVNAVAKGFDLTRRGSDVLDAVLREAGRALAARMAPAPGHPAGDPTGRVTRLLAELGGQATVEHHRGTTIIRGCGCVLGAVTADHPLMCRAVVAVLGKVAGVRVREECERGDRPSCRFVLALPTR